MKCDGLALLFHENAEGKWRVGGGLFIAAAGAGMGKELIELKRRINRKDSVSDMIFGHMSARGRGISGVPVRE
jgi:hypothetical protein